MTTRRTIFVFLLAFSWLFAQPVSAQDLSKEEIGEYRRLATESAERYAAGEYERALELLREARDIYAHRDIVYNIGLAQLKLRHCRDARTTFDSFLEREDISDDERQAGEEQLNLATSCREVVEVRVTCSPANAAVRIAGKRVACGEMTQFDEGTHRAVATADRYRSWASEVDIAPGQEAIAIALEPVPEPPPQPREPVHWRRPVAFTALGVGAAALVSAFAIDATTVRRAGRLADAESDAELDALERAGRRARTAATVLYIGGLTAAAGGAVLLGIDLFDGRAQVGIHPRVNGAAVSITLPDVLARPEQ